MSSITVLYFAELQDYAARPSEQVALEGTSTPRDLFLALQRKYHWPVGESDIRYAVNHRFVHASKPLEPGDSVAFIPPVSGG